MCSSIKKYLAWAPALTIAIMIFYFSSQPADVSTASSSQISRLLLQFADLLQLASLENANITALCELMETPVRKSAHILEFSILNISILYALHVWSMKGRKWIAAAWIITVLYACTDAVSYTHLSINSGALIFRIASAALYSLHSAGSWRRFSI